LDSYPNISEHGLIGDLQTAAPVTADGTIDFFCCPRFDSPGIFASLLDAKRGGYFRIRPATDDYVTKQLYFPDTAMLITRFMTADGVGEVLDFMPVIEGKATNRHRIVRHLRVARGTMKFQGDLQPRFNSGQTKHSVEITENGAIFRAEDGMELTLHTVRSADGRRRWCWSVTGCAARSRCARGSMAGRGARVHGRQAEVAHAGRPRAAG